VPGGEQVGDGGTGGDRAARLARDVMGSEVMRRSVLSDEWGVKRFSGSTIITVCLWIRIRNGRIRIKIRKEWDSLDFAIFLQMWGVAR